MLIADKIQNYKDFQLFHENTHPRSDRLKEYFLEWFDKLNVHISKYDFLHQIISNIRG